MSLSSLTDFEIGKTLGKGSFGMVCLVKRKFDGKTYAMKRIKIVQLSEKDKENALNEIRILASLSHKNIITALAISKDSNIITEDQFNEAFEDVDKFRNICNNILRPKK